MRTATAALIAASLIAASCSGNGEPTGFEGEDPYLSLLRGVAREVNLAIDAVDTAVDAPADSPEMLFLALADTRAARDVAIARDKALRLEPGPDQESDHERYLTFLDFALARSRDLDEAVASQDAVEAATIAFDLEAAAGLLFIGLSPEACAATTFNERLCRPPVSEEGFATAIHPHMLRLTAAYLPGIDELPLGLSPIGYNGYIAAIGPTLIEVLESALEGVRDLTPPSEVAADHEILVAYLTETAAAHERSLGAAESGDAATATVAHLAAQREFCTSGPALSQEGRRYLAVFFLDEFGICN